MLSGNIRKTNTNFSNNPPGSIAVYTSFNGGTVIKSNKSNNRMLFIFRNKLYI